MYWPELHLVSPTRSGKESLKYIYLDAKEIERKRSVIIPTTVKSLHVHSHGNDCNGLDDSIPEYTTVDKPSVAFMKISRAAWWLTFESNQRQRILELHEYGSWREKRGSIATSFNMHKIPLTIFDFSQWSPTEYATCICSPPMHLSCPKAERRGQVLLALARFPP